MDSVMSLSSTENIAKEPTSTGRLSMLSRRQRIVEIETTRRCFVCFETKYGGNASKTTKFSPG